MIMLIITAFFISSCKKDYKNSMARTVYQSPNEKTIIALIKNFKYSLTSTLKDEEKMNTDSVDWYICALANYTYGDASVKGNGQIIDTSFVSLPISEGYASKEDIITAYRSVIDSIRSHFYAIEDQDKHLLAVDITKTNETSTQLDLRIVSYILFGRISLEISEFGVNDDWKWWNKYTNNGGYCGSSLYAGTALESDAAQQINRRVMFRKSVPPDFCYIEPVTVYLEYYAYPNPDWTGNVNYYRDYLFYNVDNEPDYHWCLEYAEMNFYLHGAEHIVYTPESLGGAQPLNKTFKILNLHGDEIDWGHIILCHRGTAEFGTLIRHGTPDNL
jgi:hypothetical protein